MKLYTLYATPAQTPDFVMVASASIIQTYLRSTLANVRFFNEVDRVGEASLTIDRPLSRRDHGGGLVGHWMVVRGAHLPKPRPVADDENILSVPDDLAQQVTR